MSTTKPTAKQLAAMQEELEALRQFKAQKDEEDRAKGNLEVILQYADDDGSIVDAATLRIAALTRIKSGMGKRLAGILNHFSEEVYTHEDGDGSEGMSMEDAMSHLDANLSVKLGRCKTRFEEREEVEDKWLDESPDYRRDAPTNGASASSTFSRAASRSIGG